MILVLILTLLALLIFLSFGRKEIEKFCETKELPDGSKIPIYKWTIIGLVLAILILMFTESLSWFFVALIMVSWGGPYVEYAIKWNFYKNE